jgi:hypothetical protein
MMHDAWSAELASDHCSPFHMFLGVSNKRRDG